MSFSSHSCTNEEAIGAINEANIGAIKAPRNPFLFFFHSCFTVSVAPSINRPESSSDFTVLITSSIFLFKMNKVVAFPTLTDLCTLTFLSNLSVTAETAIVSNLGRTSLAKETARLISAFVA